MKRLLLIAILALLVTACGSMESDAPDDEPQGAANEADQRGAAAAPPRDDAAHRLDNPSGAPAPRSTPFDAAYIDRMIAHHEQGVGMARMAVVEAENDEVREMAQDMIEMHEREIEQLRGWLDEWYPHLATISSNSSQNSLTVQGETFDRAFLKAMVAHHAEAYHLSREALRRAEHTELIEFAQMIMDTQAAQMDHMQQMLNEQQ